MRSTPVTPTGARDQSYSPYLLWIIWVFWLFFLWQPVSALLTAPPSPQKAFSIGGMIAFIGLYLWITWREAFRLTRTTPQQPDLSWKSWTPISILLGLSVTMTLIHGQDSLGSLIYVSAALCGRLTAWRAALGALGLTVLAILLGVIIGAPLSAAAQIFFIIPAVGSFVYFFSQAIRTNQELRRARQEIARLAVSEERLRFARDLHDLLGHTLSLITLKSELARRLVSAAPEQAAIEIGDIETAARQALVEVREAVAGYRNATLENELSAAQELLAAAGIAFTQQGEPTTLAPNAEAALSWAVREGVTNVIRHSHARSCVITLTRQGDQAGVEVRDDGSGGEGSVGGNGLAGLRERFATLGGSCESGPAQGGGWLLVATAPTGAASGSVGVALEPREEKRVTPWFE